MLIDYKAYADKKGIQYSPFEAHKVTIATINDIAREQGVEFQPGDLFILRTGYTEAIEAAKSEEEQVQMCNSPDSAGVEDTMEAVEWFWNQDFCAVAADNLGFEVMRPTKDGVPASGTTVDYGKCHKKDWKAQDEANVNSAASQLSLFTWTSYWGDVGLEGIV